MKLKTTKQFLTVDRRKYTLLKNSSEGKRARNNLFAIFIISLLIALVFWGELTSRKVEAQTTVEVIPTQQPIVLTTPKPVPVPVVEPVAIKPSPVTTTEAKKPCNIDKLLTGKFVGQKSLVLKYYTCDQARKLLALSGTESSFCTKGTGKSFNCWGIKCGKSFCKWTSLEQALINAKKLIGKYLNMSDKDLINNKSYCGSGCKDWKSNLSSLLNY